MIKIEITKLQSRVSKAIDDFKESQEDYESFKSFYQGIRKRPDLDLLDGLNPEILNNLSRLDRQLHAAANLYATHYYLSGEDAEMLIWGEYAIDEFVRKAKDQSTEVNRFRNPPAPKKTSAKDAVNKKDILNALNILTPEPFRY